MYVDVSGNNYHFDRSKLSKPLWSLENGCDSSTGIDNERLNFFIWMFLFFYLLLLIDKVIVKITTSGINYRGIVADYNELIKEDE